MALPDFIKIKDAKEAIGKVVEMDPLEMKLVYNSTELLNDKTLKDYGIEKDSEISLNYFTISIWV